MESMRAREDISLSPDGGHGGFGLYCRSSLDYNWCSRLDEGLSSADYDNNANSVNYYYRRDIARLCSHWSSSIELHSYAMP